MCIPLLDRRRFPQLTVRTTNHLHQWVLRRVVLRWIFGRLWPMASRRTDMSGWLTFDTILSRITTNTFLIHAEFSAVWCASVSMPFGLVELINSQIAAGRHISYEGSSAKGAGESVLVLLRETGFPVSD